MLPKYLQIGFENEFNKLLSSFDKIELAEKKESLLRIFQHYD